MSYPKNEVRNEAAHAALAAAAFNDHARTCRPCSDPFLTYENGQVLCATGLALSEELRNAFRLQERKLMEDWPGAYTTMDVSLHGAKGAAAGIVNVMNARRTRRILDSLTPRSMAVPIPQPAPYIQVAHSTPHRVREHRRLPSDISTRSTDEESGSKTYYYGYSNSYPPRNHRHLGGSPGQPHYRDEYTNGGSGRRGETRQVRFK